MVDCTQGQGVVDVHLDRLLLVPGEYDVTVAAYDPTLVHSYDHHQRAMRLRVRPGKPGDRFGVVSLAPRWAVHAGDGVTS